MVKSVCYLLLPGWRGAPAGHWFDTWRHATGCEVLAQDDWWWPRRGDWMAQLEARLLTEQRLAVLVADGLACHLVVRWAAHSQQTAKVAAALLVAPPDLAQADLPPQLQAWAPWLRGRLPFGSDLVAWPGQAHDTAGQAAAMAQAWGSQLLWQPAPAPASGCDAPSAARMLGRLCQRLGLPAPTSPVPAVATVATVATAAAAAAAAAQQALRNA